MTRLLVALGIAATLISGAALSTVGVDTVADERAERDAAVAQYTP